MGGAGRTTDMQEEARAGIGPLVARFVHSALRRRLADATDEGSIHRAPREHL
jgi:hypothetical protein